MPKLFEGEHYFVVEEKPDGHVHFVQGENFSGVLSMLLLGTIKEDTKKGFKAMNLALNERSEASMTPGGVPVTE